MPRVSASFGLWLLAALLTAGQKAEACSSCGSGGADPVVLNPTENRKFYLGLTQQSGFQDVDQHGNRVKSYGPEVKQSMDLAYAQRLLPSLFISAVANFGRNVFGSDSVEQNGDLSLNARATVVQQNMAEPFIPQVQLLLARRFAVARSIYNGRQEHSLDVFGAGYSETYVGADIWWGMNTIMWGGSYIYGRPETAKTDAGKVEPGTLQRLIGTIGGIVLDDVKLIGGAIQERRGGFTLDGEELSGSDRMSHDLFLTMETLFPEGSNYRVTLNRRAAFGMNRNAVETNIVTLAWMRAI